MAVRSNVFLHRETRTDAMPSQAAPSASPEVRGSTARALNKPNPPEAVRRGTVHALEMVLLPHPMNTYGAYDYSQGPTWHVIDDKHRGWYLHYVWNSRLTGGKATITHFKSALKRRKSKETSQRWARKLDKLGLVKKHNVPDPQHGGFAPNEYWPLDPAYPQPQGDALAVVYGGEVRVLTQQKIEIPTPPTHTVRAEKPKPEKSPAPPVNTLEMPPAWNLMQAEKAGLTNRLEITLLWADYQRRSAAGKIDTPRGYWVGMCQKRVEELRQAGQQVGIAVQAMLPLQQRSPEQEREARNQFMVDTLASLLANGSAEEQAVERALKQVYPANLCITSGPTESEAWEALKQAREPAARLRTELERRSRPLTIGDETRAWLRRQYEDLRSRPVAQSDQERQLYGNRGELTPQRAALAISALPNRPAELQQASAEQMEKLLVELNL